MAKAHTLATRMPGPKSSGSALTGLRAPGLLARWPIIGVLMVLVGGLAFGALAYNVEIQGPLTQTDVSLARSLHTAAANSPPYMMEIMLFGFFLGKELPIVIAVILVLYFLHKHLWREIAMVAIGMGGGGLLWYLLIRVFDRARPELQAGPLIVTDPSFPSGHTITAILCYGLLAYLLVPRMPSAFWKWFVILSSVLVMLFIGFSRLFVDAHYLTDLLAGYALGLAWAGLVYTTFEKAFE